MVLEGAMIIICVLLLTVFHPLYSFHGTWAEAGWNLRKAKASAFDAKMPAGMELETKQENNSGIANSYRTHSANASFTK
jgi:hypothetical protein